MQYAKLVEKHAVHFLQAGLLKEARDLANLLDNELFIIKKETETFDSYYARDRELTFNKLCYACMKSNVPVPPLEPELYLVLMPEKGTSKEHIEQRKKDRATKRRILASLKGKRGTDVDTCKALINSLLVFSGDKTYGGIKTERLVAALNYYLVKLGVDPIHPDYSELKIDFPAETAPAKNVVVLVFDDSRAELLNTGRRLVGWPNVSFVFHLYKEKRWDLKGEEREATLKKAAEDIMAYKADIVLMDQGLGSSRIEGSDIVRKTIELYPDTHPIFVANTGGSPDELQNAGCIYGNCNKGEQRKPVRNAMEQLARR